MAVKHLDDLYTWKQIRKLQVVHAFNPHNGFVPVAVYAPNEGQTSCYREYYQWYGRQMPYYAKRLWEAARIELAARECDALAFDVVEASECFNTIRFKDATKARDYSHSFLRLLRDYANAGKVKSALGLAPTRPYPWDPSKDYIESIIDDNAQYQPLIIPDAIQGYQELPPLPWSAVEQYFIELTEDELAFLHGSEVLNKRPSALDRELIVACERLDVPKVASLLNSGANPNAFTDETESESLVSIALQCVADHNVPGPRTKKFRAIVDLLVAHGCDLDLCPFDSCNALWLGVHFPTSIIKFLLKKGANINAICWIALTDYPVTAFDHAGDDVAASPADEIDPELQKLYDLMKSLGGKFFEDIAPEYYEE